MELWNMKNNYNAIIWKLIESSNLLEIKYL